MNTTQKTENFIVMKNGYQVEERFYKMVLSQVEEVIPVLTPGVHYTLKMLCGEEFWNPLSDGERVLAGRCMVDMVKTRKLLLTAAGSDCHHAYQYALLIL